MEVCSSHDSQILQTRLADIVVLLYHAQYLNYVRNLSKPCHLYLVHLVIIGCEWAMKYSIRTRHWKTLFLGFFFWLHADTLAKVFRIKFKVLFARAPLVSVLNGQNLLSSRGGCHSLVHLTKCYLPLFSPLQASLFLS